MQIKFGLSVTRRVPRLRPICRCQVPARWHRPLSSRSPESIGANAVLHDLSDTAGSRVALDRRLERHHAGEGGSQSQTWTTRCACHSPVILPFHHVDIGGESEELGPEELGGRKVFRTS